MKPLAVHDPLAEAIFWIAVGSWWLGEALLAIRTTLTSEGRRDPSFFLLSLITIAAIFGGVHVANRPGAVALPGPGWWPFAVGLAVLVAGVWLRVRAIMELGRFFTYAVLVHEGQRVIDTGPYRLIRHPSYTGLLAGMLGMGLALGTWVSIAVCFLPPLMGFALRLLSEERVLAVELGEPYREYMLRTKRLVPGVW